MNIPCQECMNPVCVQTRASLSYCETQLARLKGKRAQAEAALYDAIMVMKSAPCHCSGKFICTRCQTIALAEEAIEYTPVDGFKGLAKFKRPGIEI